MRTHCCGHIAAHDVSRAAQTRKHMLQTQNVSEQNQEHFCVPETKFVSATNVARTGKQGNNVSSFASTFTTNFTATIYRGDLSFCFARYRCYEVWLERYLGEISRRLYQYLADLLF